MICDEFPLSVLQGLFITTLLDRKRKVYPKSHVGIDDQIAAIHPEEREIPKCPRADAS